MDLVERLIAADETVLYEGRAQGYPPLGCTAMGLGGVLALGACLELADSGIVLTLGGVTMKIPFVVSLLVAFAGLELFRLASWRSTRYVVTTRRVFAVSGVFWQSIWWSLQRMGAERVQASEHWGVELMQQDRLWAPLAGLQLDEAGTINLALATFDATPPGPPPAPFWTNTHTAAAVLVALWLAIVAFLWAT